MTIQFSLDAPQTTADKLADWLPEIQLAAVTGGAAGGAVLNLSDGYKVHYLSVAEIASGRLLEATHSSRWRHLVMSGPHPHGELELDDQLDPIALHEGMGKNGLLAALNSAEALEGDFEASVLIASPLRFIALWLHNDTEDLIVPYPPNATALTDYIPVSIEGTLDALRPIAEEVLEASAAAGPTGG